MRRCWLNVCIVARHAIFRKQPSCKSPCVHIPYNYPRYEPNLSDPRDDASVRDLQNEVVNGNRSRTSSISQKPLTNAKLPVVQCLDEHQSLTRKAKRIRDSWSFKSAYTLPGN